jgi:hypothetical protein
VNAGSERISNAENGIIEQKETKKTKVGSETPFTSLSSVEILLNPV